jgi:serine/threonine-protein kinase
MQSTPELPDHHPVIAGYHIGEEMGRGLLGKIYRAHHEQSGQWAVLRGFARPDGVEEARWDAAKAQFHDLLSAHQSLPAHPAIQKILGFGEEEGLFWVASEFFEAKTLHYVLTEEGPQALAWAITLFRQVADAVDWAGLHGLCHTDLTPFNILMVRSPELAPGEIQVKVINFGLAHARRKFGSRYAAPEQMVGGEGDRRSDVYSVGVLLSEVLTGKPLIEGKTANEIAAKVRSAPVPVFPNFWPAYVQNILTAMLARDPARRYDRVTQAIEDLAAKRNPSFSTDLADRADAIQGLAPREAVEKAREIERQARQELNMGVTASEALPRGSAFVYGSFAPDTRIRLQEYEQSLSEQDLLEIRRRLTPIHVI